jgi:Short C-terminal domain
MGGLGRTVARTALIAGTARAVSGRVGTRQRKAQVGMLTDQIVDQLKKLAELRDAGVLTQHEFASKKAKLLP